jgi:hypothetical protein
MSLANALMPVPRQRFVDADGVAYAGGTVTFYETGASTIPKPVFSTHRGTVSLGTIVDLDASGYLRGVYLERGGYRLVVKDAEGATVLTQDGVSDTAATYFERIGQEWSAGSVVAADHTVLATDFFITMTSSSQRTVTLPAAAAHLTPIAIKNCGSSTVLIAPAGSDEVEGVAGTWTLPAGGFPLYPAIWLYPDGVSAWWIVASDGCAATDLLERASESMSPSPSQSRSVSSSPSGSLAPPSASQPMTGSVSPSASGSPGFEPRKIEVFIWDSSGPVDGASVNAYRGTPNYNVTETTDASGRVLFTDVPDDISGLRLVVTKTGYTEWRFLFSPGTSDGPPWTWNAGFGGYYGAGLMPVNYSYAAVLGAEVLPYISATYALKCIAPYYDPEV